MYNIDDPTADADDPRLLTPSVLWLDVCEEPGLTRLCLAPRSVFELSKDYEDERLANGIFLSDIDEVRRGASSHAFNRAIPPLYQPFGEQIQEGCTTWVNPEKCFSVVASERTLAVQLAGDDSDQPVPRLQLIDLLSLYSMQSLTNSEIRGRNRRFRRVLVHPSVKVSRAAAKFPAHVLEDAERITQLLSKGIDVDEENFSPHFGTRIVPKHLSYEEETRKLHIRCPRPAADSKPKEATTPQSDTEDDGRTSHSSSQDAIKQPLPSIPTVGMLTEQQVLAVMPHLKFGLTGEDRSIDIDDVSEVRPGKVSASVDGSEDLLYVSIIASTSIVVLPVPSLVVRDNLVRRFQAFITVKRDFAAFETDSPELFRPLPGDFSPILGDDFLPQSSYLTPPPAKTLSQTMKVTFGNLNAKNAEDEQLRMSAGTIPSVSSSTAKSHQSHRRGSGTGLLVARSSAGDGVYTPPATASPISSTVYSHTKRTVSISVLRRSSASSRGQSSLSEAFNNNPTVLSGSHDH